MKNRTRRTFLSLFLSAICSLLIVWQPATAAEVPVVVSADAAKAVRLAADELAGYFSRLHPETNFPLIQDLPPSGPAIRVESIDSDSSLAEAVDADLLDTPESYVVATIDENGRKVGIVAGADPRGVVYAVYGLLEKLGCGFYLSYDAVPVGDREREADRDCGAADHVGRRSGKGPADEVACR